MEDQVRLTAQLAATTVMVPCPSRIPDLCITTTKDFKVKSNTILEHNYCTCPDLLICGQKRVRSGSVHGKNVVAAGGDPCVQMFYRLS